MEMSEDNAGLAVIETKGADEEALKKEFYESDIEFAWNSGHAGILVHSESLGMAERLIKKICKKEEGVVL